MPYNGVLLSDAINNLIPYVKGVPYVLHSPGESLETVEMETILATRGAVRTSHAEAAKLVLIHRLCLPCLNYIPGLTEHKRRAADILLFGSYLDYEIMDYTVHSTFGSGISKIFPNAGVICFTMDHLLEQPLHIRHILVYSVWPAFSFHLTFFRILGLHGR